MQSSGGERDWLCDLSDNTIKGTQMGQINAVRWGEGRGLTE